ncbi:MAG: hypothetical protein J6O90_06300, partial [Candidatus Methanomethylophilaceae archaeon]|nr:hypothetical protein [Candidatus Methanomethylophilaceae archaeon]
FSLTGQLQFDESLTGNYTKYYFSDVPLARSFFRDGSLWYSENYGMMTLETISSGRLYLDGEEFILVDRDTYGYSVRCVDLSGNEIGSTVTGSAPAGTEVDLQAVVNNIAGYVYRNSSSDRFVISPDESKNVLVLTYDVVRTVTVDLTDSVQDGKAVIDNIQSLAADGNPVRFVLPQGSIELDIGILNNLSQSAAVGLRTVDISELDESQRENVPVRAVVFSITIESMGVSVHELGGTARITIPVDLTGSNLALWYLDDSGAMHMVEDAVFADGKVSFTTDHLSYYVVGETQSSDGEGFPIIHVAIIAVAVISILGVALFLRRGPHA